MAKNGKPVLRFAPSPTGYLHIGGARTALFNWLYARRTGGVFRLRIEDTDRQRSTPEAIAAIFSGLTWMGLDWDDEPVFQFSRAERHREIAEALVARGHAYRAYDTPEELDQMRARQKVEGKPVRSRWRDSGPNDLRSNTAPVIRLKGPTSGETLIRDVVQGDVRYANDNLDDMVLLRSDGTPTYMLAVVVDDFDMGVTHVLRGDDHLNNAARQLQIIHGMDWPEPIYGHVPLIHGADGAKLSKRHGALAVEAYRDMGYLPEAMRNYLLRLGWSHGDEEIIPTARAVEWFNLEGIGRSPARFDLKKLDSINAHYMRSMDEAELTAELAAVATRVQPGRVLGETVHARLRTAMAGLKSRAKTLLELNEAAEFMYADGPRVPDAKAAQVLTPKAKILIKKFILRVETQPWNVLELEKETKAMAEAEGVSLGDIAQPLRAALTGKTTSPPVFDVMVALGREEALDRLRAHAD